MRNEIFDIVLCTKRSDEVKSEKAFFFLSFSFSFFSPHGKDCYKNDSVCVYATQSAMASNFKIGMVPEGYIYL